MVSSAEMRAQARYYTDVAATESAVPLKKLVTRHALALSQLAERIERAERSVRATRDIPPAAERYRRTP
jgi:hypothetical protein